MRKKIYSGLAGMLVAVLLVFSWFKQRVERAEGLNTALRPNESRKLVKKGNTLTLTHRDKDGREVKKTITGTRDFSISEDYSGKITVYAPTKGWILEPGLAVAFSDRPRYGVDLQFAYWNNFGLGALLVTDSKLSMRVGVEVSYTIYSNTSLYVGIDQYKTPMVGVRVRL